MGLFGMVTGPGNALVTTPRPMTNPIKPNRHNEVPVLPAQMELIEEQLGDLLQWARTQPLDVRLQVFAMLWQS
jgi:hypothetical protein